MQDEAVLKAIEQNIKENEISAKLYRYQGLIQAIEYFSQKMNYEQIIDAAFEFVNELLTIEKSCIYILQDNKFELKTVRGDYSNLKSFQNNNKLEQLPLFHAGLLDENSIPNFFDVDVYEKHNINVAIPIIMDIKLVGFIFVSNKVIGEIDSEDIIICEALMKLFNNALDNYKKFEEIKEANKQLDEKIFNMFAINQSSKALLNELSLNELFPLSVEVFSELTQSEKTGFFLFDERSEKFELKAYKDVFKNTDCKISLEPKSNVQYDYTKQLINMSLEENIEYFKSLFVDSLDILLELSPLYIVLLFKNNTLMGFVTLGTTVTGKDYSNSIFELIESLASSTYIALKNAYLLKEIEDKKMLLQEKLNRLTTLNNLMKNINSSPDKKTLVELTLKTIELSFGVSKAMFTIYNETEECLMIEDCINVDYSSKEISINSNWERIFKGKIICHASQDKVLDYISEKNDECLTENSGILIIPLYIEDIDITLLGCIIVFAFQDGSILSDEENIITLDTISNHIAPVLSNLISIEKQKSLLIPNYRQIFFNELQKQLNICKEFDTELEIAFITDKNSDVFRCSNVSNILKDKISNVFQLCYDKTLVIIKSNFNHKKQLIFDLLDLDNCEIKIFKYREDFNNILEFQKLFSNK